LDGAFAVGRLVSGETTFPRLFGSRQATKLYIFGRWANLANFTCSLRKRVGCAGTAMIPRNGHSAAPHVHSLSATEPKTSVVDGSRGFGRL